MSTNNWLITVGVILLVIFAWMIGIYNKLIHMIEAIRNNEKQIDIQLDRRFKVFESLINTVKQYMNYEQTTLKDVVSLRNKANIAKTNGDNATRMSAENQLSRIANDLNVVFEQYPDLKANTNALQLQEEIVNTENKLAYAKQAYNDSIERYNATKRSFLEAFIVNLFRSQLERDFVYWTIDATTRTTQEDYTVKF